MTVAALRRHCNGTGVHLQGMARQRQACGRLRAILGVGRRRLVPPHLQHWPALEQLLKLLPDVDQEEGIGAIKMQLGKASGSGEPRRQSCLLFNGNGRGTRRVAAAVARV